MENKFKIEVIDPLPIEVLAALQDARSGGKTSIYYLTIKEIKEKFPEVDEETLKSMSNGTTE